MNLSTSGLFQNARCDVINRSLENSANGKGVVFDPTSKAISSNHNADKQAEENATWFFEYRALLNSKLTTLTTSLTSAYTTDLDASMGVQGLQWGAKNAMQGNTGQKFGGTTAVIDPGAARSAFAYFQTFGDPIMSSSATWAGSPTSSGNATEGATALMTYPTGGTSTVAGSTTFLTGGSATFLLDQLRIDQLNTANNSFTNDKATQLSGAGYGTTKKVGNQLELTLYKFFAQPANLDILRFGLFQNVFIVGTSSLPTGSQVQGSVKLDYDSNTGRVNCTQERYAAFFHS